MKRLFGSILFVSGAAHTARSGIQFLILYFVLIAGVGCLLMVLMDRNEKSAALLDEENRIIDLLLDRPLVLAPLSKLQSGDPWLTAEAITDLVENRIVEVVHIDGEYALRYIEG